MKALGGYFELELANGEEYHKSAIHLNTGRNALEYILRAKKYQKIYIPFYTCDVILEPLEKLKIPYEFYSIDKNFEINFDSVHIKSNEAVLYTNYFGLKDDYIKSLKKKGHHLIIDNAQAFYAEPVANVDTFYSARKFFGVPDGAYLYTDTKLAESYPTDISYERFEHLLRRIDQSAEDGFRSFTENDAKLGNQPILQMSHITLQLLKNINYKEIAKRRRENYNLLHESLRSINGVHFDLKEGQVPLVYPFYSEDSTMRQRLIEKKIYTASYWQNVLTWTKENSIEYNYAKNLVHLPIDQRLNLEDIKTIIKYIKS